MVARRMIHSVVVVGLAAAGAAGVQLVNPTAALARCVGAHAPTTSNLYAEDTGKLIAWETPVGGTCDSNGLYQATLSAASGWTPAVYTENGGQWTLRKRGAGDWAVQADTHKTQEVLCAYNNVTNNGWCGIGRFVQKVYNGGVIHTVNQSVENYGF